MSWQGAWEGGWAGGFEGHAAEEVAPVPASTTWPTIRALQLELVRELAPTILPSMRFRELEANERDLAAWAEAAGGGAFRVFHIVHNEDQLEPVWKGEEASKVSHSETVLVAYPNQVDLWDRRLDDIIDQDLHDLTRILGLRARADYAGISQGLLSVKRVSTFRQPGEAAAIVGAVFELHYDRTVP